MATDFHRYLTARTQLGGEHGFDPTFIPAAAFPFQAELIEWACRRGRAALFADCGLGKTLMQLAWAENVARQANGQVLVLTPLAVAEQTVAEGMKFGIECERSLKGEPVGARIVVTNYERLHYFDRSDFVGVVCDESSILKNFGGKRKRAVTEFMRKMPYRLLCTATASPNDYIELGTHSEALGELGFNDMLGKFFRKEEATTSRRQEYAAGTYRFRGHAREPFWRWVASWARAVRHPSDLGFSDDGFELPPLDIREHVVESSVLREGMLFAMPAVGLREQREERRNTIKERCDLVAELVADTDEPAVVWCHLNDEGDRLEKLIPDSLQVAGRHTDEHKESVLESFSRGDLRVLVTKPRIAGFGLNWQHCAHQTFFPSHSFEQWYQATRRCWRFGQKRPVIVDVVSSEGEAGVTASLETKARKADEMFQELIGAMGAAKTLTVERDAAPDVEVPQWM